MSPKPTYTTSLQPQVQSKQSSGPKFYPHLGQPIWVHPDGCQQGRASGTAREPFIASMRGALLLREQALHARLDLSGQQRDRLQQVLLRESADVHLEEVAHMAHVAVQVDNALGHFVG